MSGKNLVKKRKPRNKWTPRQDKTLKRTWTLYTRKEIAQKVDHSIPTMYVRARKLGLPMQDVKQSRARLKPIGMLSNEGVVKCHNCLVEIVLSKKGLDRDYKGGRVGKDTIFWHLPGKCPGDRSAHYNQLKQKRSRRGRPSEYEILDH